MTINTRFEEEIKSLKIIAKEFESNPRNTLTTLDERVAALLQNSNFESFRKGLQTVRLRIKDLQVKILNGKEIDLPIEAIGLFNLVSETHEGVARRHRELKIEEALKTNNGQRFQLALQEHFSATKQNLELRNAILHNNYPQIRAILLADPASVNGRDGRESSFRLVCRMAPSSVVNLFIRAGANVDYSFDVIAALILSASIRHSTLTVIQEKLKLLLDAGANPNESMEVWNFAEERPDKVQVFAFLLAHAPSEFLIPAIPQLVDAGLELNFIDVDGMNYLSSFLNTTQLENAAKIIQALVFNGANVGEKEQKATESSSHIRELQCSVKIRQEAYERLSRLTVIVDLLEKLEPMQSFPTQLLNMINSYHTPNLKEQRELCYELSNSTSTSNSSSV